MATKTRTDIHRPSAPEFNPEDYDCIGVYDLHPEEGDHHIRRQMVRMQLALGRSFDGAPHGFGQCSHCGTRLRYAALMVHLPTDTLMWAGEQCLENRFEVTLEMFREAREAGKARSAAAARKQAIAALVDEHPLLAWLTYPAAICHLSEFIWDISEKLRRNGTLSPRQIEAVERVILEATVRDDEREARARQDAEKAAAGVQAPEGKVTVTGTIVSVRTYDNDYGPGFVVKMLVEADEGWKVWTTMPASIARTDAGNGTRVEFTATLHRPNDDDPTFAKGQRPSRARIL